MSAISSVGKGSSQQQHLEDVGLGTLSMPLSSSPAKARGQSEHRIGIKQAGVVDECLDRCEFKIADENQGDACIEQIGAHLRGGDFLEKPDDLTSC